jgi:hypothetical protein
VNFYVSDERNAIGDFEHLNVTVETVSFRRVGGDGNEGGGDETETSEPTETPEGEGDDGTETPEPTETADPTETPDDEADEGEAGDDREGEVDADEDESGDDAEGDGEWIAREVNGTTVDLTELQGENATMLSRFDLPNGTYTGVRLHVAEVNGTLTSGEDVRVKLPSERLKLKERFAVGDGEEVDFVFDATVFKAGKSGKYILKPVASESGTDVPIREVERDDGREGRLGVRFLGSVRPGEAATVKVSRDGEAVSGATVDVGERTYRTGSDGTVMFDVPGDAEELEVEIAAGDAEAELTRTFGGGDDDEADNSGGGSDGESEAGDPGSQSDDGQGNGEGKDGGADGSTTS